jgi:hypothetical protein
VYGRKTVDALDLPGYGAVRQEDLQGWEPWRLQMWGLVKNSDGTILSTGGPAWTTATGASKTLFDQVNNISKMPGMETAYTGGAAGTSDDGLGSKEAMIWDLTQKLISQGVTNLTDLKERTVQQTVSGESGDYTQNVTEFYNTKTGQTVNLQGTTLGSNQTNYTFQNTGTGLVIPTTSGTQSDWVQFRDTVMPLAMAFVSLAYPAAAPYIQAYNAASRTQRFVRCFQFSRKYCG